MTAKTSKRFSPIAFTAPTAEEPVPTVTPSSPPDASPFKAPAVAAPRRPEAKASLGRPLEKSSSQDAETAKSQDIETPVRPDVKTPGRTAFTWRLTPDEADRLDMLLLEVRRSLGVGRLDRAAMLQALVDLTSERQDVKADLTARLQGA